MVAEVAHHVVLLSGGKDSTAMALRLAEVEPRPYTYLCTPTGNELPPLVEHWKRLEDLLGAPIHRIGNRTLMGLILEQHALPNWRQRWCTRILKIEAFKGWLLDHLPAVAYVGLRADEAGREGVAYTEDAIRSGLVQRYPLSEWGWDLSRVRQYLNRAGCCRAGAHRLRRMLLPAPRRVVPTVAGLPRGVGQGRGGRATDRTYL